VQQQLLLLHLHLLELLTALRLVAVLKRAAAALPQALQEQAL
jgi:hypothetical protein